MSKLYFYNYNNYYNRIVKKEANLLAYGTPTYTLDNANFYEADGCDTKHTINIRSTDSDIFNANYLLVLDSNYDIKSRWFVTEVEHSRNRQYILSLRRDLLVDFYDSVINDSPVLIEKALVDKNNPLIFNSEGFEFNQIKKDEILLPDSYNSRWIYIYMAKNATDKTVTVNYQPFQAGYDYSVNNISNSIFDGVEHNSYSLKDNTAVEIYAKYWCEYDGFKNYQYKKTFSGYSALLYTSNSYNLKIKFPGWNYYISSTTEKMKNAVKMNDTLMSALITDYHSYLGSGNYMSLDEENFLNNAVGKKIYEQSTGQYYVVTSVTKSNATHEIKNSLAYNFCTVLTNQLSSYFYDGTTPDNNTYNAELEYTTYTVNIAPIEDLSFTVNVAPSTHATTDDNECNILAIPIEGFRVQTGPDDPDTGEYPYTDIDGYDDINIAIARSIAMAYGKDVVYDVQILPYGPFPTAWTHAGEIDIEQLNTKNYTALTYSTKYAGYLFYLSQSNFTFDICKVINIDNYTEDDSLNVKLSNECDLYRLCSPNYNGLFEFSVAKNNGVTKFNVDMTLRPYNPYIHINPDFKGLYGDDYNDSRGLILGGDFSIPIISDAFVNYELQNKNYQLIFDRQIKHMDKENKLARIEAGFGAVTGAIQGGVGGAVVGAGIGGNTGSAVAGGLTGGIASALGGAMDYTFLKKRQNENKDLAIDMFTYNLGNIKALPYSLTKVNPITYNNKKFPFIEYYSCTNEEKDILLEKIKYNSMTVMSIGYIADYLKEDMQFIKGTLIRFISDEAINDHEIYEIYNELKKGVYI